MIVPAQRLILEAWIGIGLMLIGLGSLVRRLCGAPAQGAGDLLRSFWIGWALLLVLLQVWYLFLPVNERALAAMAILGAVGLVLGGSRPWLAMLRGLRRSWLPLLGLALLAVWLSNRALEGPRFGDTPLYHIPKVRWIVEHRIVPGLGNLYMALAHNQSWFLYLGMLEFGPFARRSYHIANGMLVIALYAQCLLSIARALRRGRACTPVDTMYALLAPAILIFGTNMLLTCPSADMAISMVGIVVSAELLRVLCRPHPRAAPDFDLICVALLAVEAATIKLSILGLVAAAGGLAVLTWLWRARRARDGMLRTAAALGTLLAFCGGLWVLGNVILSGYALFPTPYGAVPVEWRIPFDLSQWVEEIRLGAPLSYAWVDPHWFIGRLQSFSWDAADVMVPLVLAGTAAVALIVQLPLRMLGRIGRPVPMAVVLPPVASLLFTLANAPMPRYAGAAVWLLAVNIALLALGGAAAGQRRIARIAAVVVAVAVAGGMLAQQTPLWLAAKDFVPVSRQQVTAQQLETGLIVQVPVKGLLCGDSPLPCTPLPHPALRLRRDGDLSSGFMMDPGLFEKYKDTPWHASGPRMDHQYAMRFPFTCPGPGFAENGEM